MDTGPFPTAPSGGIVPPVPARDTGAWLAAEDMDAVAALVRAEALRLPGVAAPELRWWLDAFDRELVCPLAASGVCGVPRCASSDHTGCFAPGGQLHREGDEAHGQGQFPVFHGGLLFWRRNRPLRLCLPVAC